LSVPWWDRETLLLYINIKKMLLRWKNKGGVYFCELADFFFFFGFLAFINIGGFDYRIQMTPAEIWVARRCIPFTMQLLIFNKFMKCSWMIDYRTFLITYRVFFLTHFFFDQTLVGFMVHTFRNH
jgi:hypothetical protein